MIGIVDYGMGNLRSVENALKKIGQESVISDDPDILYGCEKVILPGVGAFGDCMKNLQERGLQDVICRMIQEGKPLLGICVGMQMMYEYSEEKGIHAGLSVLKGKVIRFETELPVPEIGWNTLQFKSEHPLREILGDNAFVYYVHSYYASACDPDEVIACSEYGGTEVPGIVQKKNVIATQFHPEKSGETGLRLLRYFAEEFL